MRAIAMLLGLSMVISGCSEETNPTGNATSVLKEDRKEENYQISLVMTLNGCKLPAENYDHCMKVGGRNRVELYSFSGNIGGDPEEALSKEGHHLEQYMIQYNLNAKQVHLLPDNIRDTCERLNLPTGSQIAFTFSATVSDVFTKEGEKVASCDPISLRPCGWAYSWRPEDGTQATCP